MMNKNYNINDINTCIVYSGVNQRTLPEAVSPDQVEEVEMVEDEASTMSSVSNAKALTTKAGKPRCRIKWTIEMNTFIMRSFYRITKLETDMTSYRCKLHEQFIHQYPELSHITEQRISDQRRAVLRGNMIPSSVLQVLRQEIALELNMSQVTEELNSQPSEMGQCTLYNDGQIDINKHGKSLTDETSVDTCGKDGVEKLDNECESDGFNDSADICSHFQKAMMEFAGMDPSKRPIIPKINTSKRMANTILCLNTKIIPPQLAQCNDLEHLHTLIYCAGIAAARHLGYSVRKADTNKRYERKQPSWERRLVDKREDLRRDIGRLTQFQKGNRTRKIDSYVYKIMKRHRRHSTYDNDNTSVIQTLDTLKQKLCAVSRRLARYKISYQRKQDNKLFETNQRIFYRGLNSKQQPLSEFPDAGDLERFWSTMWSNSADYNDKAVWLQAENIYVRNISAMPFKCIMEEDVKKAIINTLNWKAPGPDGVQNFWIKRFTCVHSKMAQLFSEVLLQPDRMPAFLTKGITYLLPKNTQTNNPANYRPITCLPTMYKILTACLTNTIYKHCEENNILKEEQKGCKRNSFGCKEQLVIDSVILEQARKNQRNLHMAYIDYRKAFDSIPHSWLLKVLEIYKVNSTIIDFLKIVMTNWQTALCITGTGIKTNDIEIKRGIFQGDSLSALWFCIALNPLGNQLNDSGYGYKITDGKMTYHRMTHLLYMDDLKLFASTDSQLQHLLDITRSFSNDICMSFGLDKCRRIHTIKGKIVEMDFNVPVENTLIESMKEGDIYKYLGVEQGKVIDHTKIKKKLTELFKDRLHNILKTGLNARNKVKAINTYAIPILIYSFGIIKWSVTDLEGLQRLMRTTMTKHHFHHPRSAMERMTIPRGDGGRGIIDILNMHNRQVALLRNYFYEKEISSELHSAIVKSDRQCTPLDLYKRNMDILAEPDKYEMWACKELHGRHYYDLEQQHVDKDASNKWLKCGDLFGETEGFMCAIQDQVINTKNYLRYIVKDSKCVDDRCRKCHAQSETIEHILSGCKIMAHTEYLHRHNQVANILHQKLAIKCGLLSSHIPYYQYVPEAVMENEEFRLYWDRSIITDKTIHNNRPDITLIDKGKAETYIIDIAVPSTRNLQKTYADKMEKYTDLSIEMKNMWKQNKVYIVPLVLSATGIIPHNLISGLTKISMKKNTYIEMQKAVIINTCHLMRKFLNE